MTTEIDRDLALTALLSTATEIKTELPESFIKASYAIQRRHQFNQDQTVSLHDLEKLVDDHVGQVQGEGL